MLIDTKEEMREAQELARGHLKDAYDGEGHVHYISSGEFVVMYQRSEYEELSEGFFGYR